MCKIATAEPVSQFKQPNTLNSKAFTLINLCVDPPMVWRRCIPYPMETESKYLG